VNATTREIDRIMARPTCSVEEAAKVLNTGRRQVYAAVKAGEIRSIRISRRVLVPTVALRQLLEGGTGHAA
jgi:excisionase family DNA binding protein